MADEQEARDHHYVPRLYLKGFAGDDGMLTIIDRRWGSIRRKSPRAVFWTRDYYRVEGVEGGGNPTAFEDAFANLENKAAPVLRQILSTATLPAVGSADYGTLMNFVALQVMRAPHARRRLHEVTRVMKRVLEHQQQLHEAFGPPGPNAKLESLRQHVERERTTGDHVEALVTAASAILQPLADRNWTLLHAGEGAHFITSDQPVSLEWSDSALNAGFFGPGFGLAGTDVSLPLSPDILMFGRFEALPPSGTTLPLRKVALSNRRVLVHAVRYAASMTEEIVFLKDGPQILGTADLAALWRANPVSPEEDLDAEE